MVAASNPAGAPDRYAFDAAEKVLNLIAQPDFAFACHVPILFVR
jgi:hypothetical protein